MGIGSCRLHGHVETVQTASQALLQLPLAMCGAALMCTEDAAKPGWNGTHCSVQIVCGRPSPYEDDRLTQLQSTQAVENISLARKAIRSRSSLHMITTADGLAAYLLCLGKDHVSQHAGFVHGRWADLQHAARIQSVLGRQNHCLVHNTFISFAAAAAASGMALLQQGSRPLGQNKSSVPRSTA